MNCSRLRLVLCSSVAVVSFFLLHLWLFHLRPSARIAYPHLSLLKAEDDPVFRRPLHPLDPLTFSELRRIHSLLVNTSLAANPRNPTPPSNPKPPIGLHAVALEEPPKEDVLAWRDGYPLPPRKASVLMMVNEVVYKVVVDLSLGAIESEEAHQGTGKPMLNYHDTGMATSMALAYPEFLESLKSRGLEKKDVVCLPLAPGWFGDEEGDDRRIIKVQCYSFAGTANFYLRPIEGITFVVDLDFKTVEIGI